MKSECSQSLPARGKDPAADAHEDVTAYLNGANQSGTKPFEEILAPIREGWGKSGMSDGEVDDLFEHELNKFIAPRTSLLGPDVNGLALTGQIIIEPLPAMEAEFDVIKAELAVHE
jgi:hypothetical protein